MYIHIVASAQGGEDQGDDFLEVRDKSIGMLRLDFHKYRIWECAPLLFPLAPFPVVDGLLPWFILGAADLELAHGHVFV